jgi:hypothetical protein
MHNIVQGTQIPDLCILKKSAKEAKLPPEVRSSVAGSLPQNGRRPVRMFRRERVVQVTDDSASREKKMPRFTPVRCRGLTGEPGLIVREDQSQVVVVTRRAWFCIMEVTD